MWEQVKRLVNKVQSDVNSQPVMKENQSLSKHTLNNNQRTVNYDDC